MKITSKEYLRVEQFKPFKYIEIYRNGIKIYTLRTADTSANLADLKRAFRHNAKIHAGGERLKRLAVADNENGYYSLLFCDYYKNMAEEYAAIKRLKEQLEREHAGTIRVETATTKKDYHKQFKIVYVNWVA